jgi:hypothetical protein
LPNNRDLWVHALVVENRGIPEGGSESFVIPGRALFNRVKIYDDERVISRIIDFIQTGLSAEKRE